MFRSTLTTLNAEKAQALQEAKSLVSKLSNKKYQR